MEHNQLWREIRATIDEQLLYSPTSHPHVTTDLVTRSVTHPLCSHNQSFPSAYDFNLNPLECKHNKIPLVATTKFFLTSLSLVNNRSTIICKYLETFLQHLLIKRLNNFINRN